MSNYKMEKPIPASKSKLKQLTSPVPPPPLPEKALSELVAKSPPATPQGGLSSTLQSRGSDETNRVSRDETAMRVLTYGALQVLCGVLMIVLGVLALVHRSSMGRCGAGLWNGGAALSAGIAGVMASMRAYHTPGEPLGATATTVYLALCLVSMAVSVLALGLTSTGLLRDLRQPPIYDEEVPLASWAPLLPSAGLLLVTILLLVSLVVAALRVYRQVCPCSRRPSPRHRLLESPASSQYATSKQGLVHSWLGLPPSATAPRHTPILYPHPPPQPGLIVYPPTLLVDSNGMYTVPPSSIGYPQRISPMQGKHYMQRRRSPHPHRGRNSVTPDSTTKRSIRPEKAAPREKKEKEITDEQLEKTYTGLDREIAEEFISIAMNSESQHGSTSRPSSRDRVIDCIAPM